MKKITVILFIFLLSSCRVQNNQSTKDNNGVSSINVPVNFQKIYDEMFNFVSVDIGNNKIYAAGGTMDDQGNQSGKIVEIDSSGNIQKTFSTQYEDGITRIKFIPGRKSIIASGQTHDYKGFLMELTASTLAKSWVYHFGSDVSSRYFSANDFVVNANKIFYVGYGSPYYGTYVRYYGSGDLNEQSFGGSVLETQPGGRESHYDGIALVNKQLWLVGYAYKLVSSEKAIYENSCIIGRADEDKGIIDEKFIEAFNDGSGLYCTNLSGIKVTTIGGEEKIFVLGGESVTSTAGGDNFIGILKDINTIDEREPLKTNLQSKIDVITYNFDVFDNKIAVVGYIFNHDNGEYYGVIFNLTYNNGKYTSSAAEIPCKNFNNAKQCEFRDVKFIGPNEILIVGSADSKGLLLTRSVK